MLAEEEQMSTFSPHDLTDFLPDNLLIKAKKEFPWADLFWSAWRIFTGGRGGKSFEGGLSGWLTHSP